MYTHFHPRSPIPPKNRQRVATPKCKNPVLGQCKLIQYRVSASSDSPCESRAFRQTFITLAMAEPCYSIGSQAKIWALFVAQALTPACDCLLNRRACPELAQWAPSPANCSSLRACVTATLGSDLRTVIATTNKRRIYFSTFSIRSNKK
jgi:hypothetical protein